MNKEYTKHLKPAAAAGWRESWSGNARSANALVSHLIRAEMETENTKIEIRM